MKTTLLACSILLLSFFFNEVKAQTDTTVVEEYPVDTTQYFDYTAPLDSTFYDLGRVRMQKKFTQGFTIKAADLEKMPFMDLKEALAVYYNGIYGATQKFNYIINGVLNTDINAYSIYDIDEITFIQNAATTLNGGLPSQVLVLVKTKHGGPDASGVIVNAQTNVIKRYIPSVATTSKNAENSGVAAPTLYHQFNVSAYTSSSWISAGLSANLQRDVFPAYKAANYWDIKFQPYTVNRYKGNGFVDIKIDTNNVMSLNAGYVSQDDAEARKRSVIVLNTKVETGHEKSVNQNVLFGNFQYRSTIIDRITNKLSASFQQLKLRGGVVVESLPVSDTVGTKTSYTIKDDIAYRFELGSLIITPQLNLTYRKATDTSNMNYYVVLTRIRGYNNSQKLFTATPSIAVNIKDFLSVQVGAQKPISAKTNFVNTRTVIDKNITGPNGVFFPEYSARPSEFNNSTATTILPFASFSVDLVKGWHNVRPRKTRPKVFDPSTAVMLYASFARSTSYTGDFYGALSDHVSETGDGQVPVYELYNTGKAYNQLDGGLTYSLLKKGLSFSYNYSNSKFATVYYVRAKSGNPPDDSAKLAIANIEIHRLSINFSPVGNHKLKWTTNLNGTYVANNSPNKNYYTDQMRLFFQQKDDQLYIKGIITGGFVNQLSYKRAYAGVNVLYGFKKSNYISRSIATDRYVDYTGSSHVLNLQSAYIGYQLKLFSWVKSLDVFVNGRNLWQKSSESPSYLHYSANDSRFYGGGFKLGL
jgi:hypothetical protein